MSSEALMEKPNNGKYRSRKQYWYFILVSLLLWFILFSVYSSSETASKKRDSFSDNNQMNDVDSSTFDSVRDTVRKDSKDDSTEDVLDNNNGDSVGEPENEAENDHKSNNFFVDGAENVDQILGLVHELEAGNDAMVEERGTQSADSDSGLASEEGEPRNEAVNKGNEDEELHLDLSSNGEKESADPSSEVDKRQIHAVPKRRPKRAPRRPKRRNVDKPIDSSRIVEKRTERDKEAKPESDSASCSGRYIYIHNIPKKFNQDLLDNCRSLSQWTDMCEYTSNLGLGSPLPDFEKVYSKTGWFATNQFLLEIIFHNRMKQYKCLTEDPSLASAIYVPYYAGLDVGRYLWDPDGFMRDYDALNLVRWLKGRNEWKTMWGRDHFLVAGRINWDFRRDPKNESDWGNELLNLPECRNMTMLVLESSPWNYNDFAIPYPTYFHPSRDSEVFQWQNRMRRQKRRYLFSFAGAPRPNLHESIRNEIIDQCRASKRKCRLLECEDKNNKCYKPVYVMKMFQNSVFCLQPPGDSYTRRSVFDSILAGCIPVFFHPGTAYVQYIWHLPKDYTKYSVYIPAGDVKSGKASIERILQQIPRQKRLAMREEVIRLIPKVIYADPTSRLDTLEDAFDLTIKGILDRVETLRKQIREGKALNSEFEEEDSWKYFTYGTVEPHEWDPIFANKNVKA